MKRLVLIISVLSVILLGCRGRCRLLDMRPNDSDFDRRVDAVTGNFERVLEDFILLQEEYNNHLFGNHPGTTEEMYAYMSVCEREVLANPSIDTSLSALSRLDSVDVRLDSLVDCAWVFERSFSTHYNRYHGVWNCEWAKFYSPVPDNLAPATYIRRVEENLEGVTGFIRSLRLDFADHIEEHH